jgi:hypothetical protein
VREEGGESPGQCVGVAEAIGWKKKVAGCDTLAKREGSDQGGDSSNDVVIVGLTPLSVDCQTVTTSLGFSTTSLPGRAVDAVASLSSKISFQTPIFSRL